MKETIYCNLAIRVTKEQHAEIQQIAREQSVARKQDLTTCDIIRDALRQTYHCWHEPVAKRGRPRKEQ
jgi:hypothetical protein